MDWGSVASHPEGYRRAAKKSRNRSAARSAYTPGTTSTTCSDIRSRVRSQTEPHAPAFSSHAPKTVSYTHLDVYKRQGTYSGCR